VLSIIAYWLSGSFARRSKTCFHTLCSLQRVWRDPEIAEPFRQIPPRNAGTVTVQNRLDEQPLSLAVPPT
jgi:hypothetical protein